MPVSFSSYKIASSASRRRAFFWIPYHVLMWTITTKMLFNACEVLQWIKNSSLSSLYYLYLLNNKWRVFRRPCTDVRRDEVSGPHVAGFSVGLTAIQGANLWCLVKSAKGVLTYIFYRIWSFNLFYFIYSFYKPYSECLLCIRAINQTQTWLPMRCIKGQLPKFQRWSSKERTHLV